MSATANNQHCQGKQLAAYLDGELDDETGAQLESHLKECPLCKAELTEQRRLLCALDSALSRNSAVALPKDFVQVVAAHAESDMRGIREPREHRRALRLCAGLALASFALLGAASIGSVVALAGAMVKGVSGIFDLAWTTVFDAVAGVTVISRVVSRRFFPESHLAVFIVFLLLALVVVLLSRMIASYHRTRLSE